MRMRSLTLSIFTVATLGLSLGVVSAADMPLKAVRSPVALTYDWRGFYFGGHIGYGWADPDISLIGGGSIANHVKPNGFLGGGQVGFNWQAGSWVFGVEADASYGNLDETRTCVTVPSGGTLSCRGAPKYFGTIDGRLGYAINNWLWYGKAGAAWSHEDFTQLGITTGTCVGIPCTGSVVQWGWNVGAGVEIAVVRNWSVKLEYDYLDFDHSDTVTVSNGTTSNVFNLTKTIQTVKFGVNYKFDWWTGAR